MTTTWNKITKASGTAYTKVSGGITLYDDVNTTYDSALTNYDGQFNSWTNIAKPVALWSVSNRPWLSSSPWTTPAGITWTNITKAT